MSPGLFVGLLLVGLIAVRLLDLYDGGHYECPVCGARDQGQHAPDCPWTTR